MLLFDNAKLLLLIFLIVLNENKKGMLISASLNFYRLNRLFSLTL